MSANPMDWSLVDGWLPTGFAVLGFAALAATLVTRRRTWWLRTVPVVVTACTAVTAALVFTVDVLWRPFPDPLPPAVMVWVGLAVLALALAVIRCVARPRRAGRSALIVAAALVVGLVAAVQANGYFSMYPSLRAALGLTVPATPFDQVARPAATLVGAPPGGRLSDVWRAPAGMPAAGTVSEVAIPSSRGFPARPAWVYLPPAYHATPRAKLPVLVLVAGQPGSPRDWIDAGQLTVFLDGFAQRHGGLAPIVVMPDHLGSTLANPLCLDSRLGNVETYLAVDVPNWIRTHLQAAGDPKAWAIAGFSQGGTCALQLAVRAPGVYPSFVDIAGQREPTVGSRKATVDRAFGGDSAAFARVNPMDVLGRARFPNSAGMIVAGEHDARYLPEARDVFDACRRAGMDVHWTELPGGHTWAVWRPGLQKSLPWLANRLGLIR